MGREPGCPRAGRLGFGGPAAPPGSPFPTAQPCGCSGRRLIVIPHVLGISLAGPPGPLWWHKRISELIPTINSYVCNVRSQ